MTANASARQTGFLSRILNTISNNEAILGLIFVLPSLIGFTAFFAVPAIRSIFISFTEWNLLREPEWVGLANYQDIFADERFWRSLTITISYVLWNIPIQTVLAVIMALLMNRVSNSAIFRSIMILPWLMPNVIVASLFLWLLDPTLGIVNIALEAVGIGRQGFFGLPDQAIATIAGVNIWRHMGYNAVLLFAGLKTIPTSLYEAATVDGANASTRFFRITLPLLRPVLAFVIITSVIGSFQIFDTIAVTTQGGPAGATRTIIFYIYQEVFERRISMGTATAASTVLFLILVTITLIQNRFFRSDRSDLADYS
ncbi:MAG TPA: sugar ABC transporter permease [Aggregatilineales bacterium]|nr:sugar ABC transporter permease [Aggregatilineales bacterium]